MFYILHLRCVWPTNAKDDQHNDKQNHTCSAQCRESIGRIIVSTARLYKKKNTEFNRVTKNIWKVFLVYITSLIFSVENIYSRFFLKLYKRKKLLIFHVNSNEKWWISPKRNVVTYNVNKHFVYCVNNILFLFKRHAKEKKNPK